MKRLLYSLLTAGTVLSLSSQPVQATAAHTRTDNPAETERKAATREKVATTKKSGLFKRSSHHKLNVTKKLNHAMRVVLGLEESKAVTSPAKRNRQMHAHQRRLHLVTRMASPSRR